MENKDNIEKIEIKKKTKKYIILLFLLFLIIICLLFWIHGIKYVKIIEDKKTKDDSLVVGGIIGKLIIDDKKERVNSEIKNEVQNKIVNEFKNTGTEKEEKPKEIVKEFIVTNKKKKWNEDIRIFNDKKYTNMSVIYPGISNTFDFELKNTLDTDIICKIDFKEENKENIPIKYKLREKDTYLRGDKDNYINYDKLNIKDIIVPSNVERKYQLDWKWIDDGKYTNDIGNVNKDIIYKLQIIIEAREKIQ